MSIRRLYDIYWVMIIKMSIPFPGKIVSGITITEEWLNSEICECSYHLQKAGVYVRAMISDDHASNARAFKLLLNF